MQITVNGDISPTYCQNLCLIFFPGEKFAEKENDGKKAYFEIKNDGGNICADVVLTVGDERFDGHSSIDPTVERASKLALGKAMLEAGTKACGFTPPWGILTGVRPSKISNQLLYGGMTQTEAVAELENHYLIRHEKAILLTEISENQKKAFSLAGDGTCSLYVSIPFCPTRCDYCSFVSYSTPRYLSLIPEYLGRLKDEITEKTKNVYSKGKKIISVYIGGGTPSILSAAQLTDIVKHINGCLRSDILEFTVEAGRPDTITSEKLEALRQNGVGRISINPQILDDRILGIIGRRHTVDEFYRIYDMALKYRFDSINTDLIAGLPGSDSSIFADTIDKITELSPDNVTVHTFCAKKSSKFAEEAHLYGDCKRIYSPVSSETALSVDYSQKKLSECGYSPYYIYRQKNAQGNLENVGFSKKGKEGLYNIFIMEELHDIIACGAGAVSKTLNRDTGKIERVFNPKYTYEYLLGKEQE